MCTLGDQLLPSHIEMQCRRCAEQEGEGIPGSPAALAQFLRVQRIRFLGEVEPKAAFGVGGCLGTDEQEVCLESCAECYIEGIAVGSEALRLIDARGGDVSAPVPDGAAERKSLPPLSLIT